MNQSSLHSSSLTMTPNWKVKINHMKNISLLLSLISIGFFIFWNYYSHGTLDKTNPLFLKKEKKIPSIEKEFLETIKKL
jgi:hypothetical protein